MKQIFLICLTLILISGCVSNKAIREQQDRMDQLEEDLAQNNEELVVLRKEIMQSRRDLTTSSADLDPEYVQSQFLQNEEDMKGLIAEVAEMAAAMDILTEDVVNSDREIVNMIRDLENRINALRTEGLSPEQAAALTPDIHQMEVNTREIDNLQAEISALKLELNHLKDNNVQAATDAATAQQNAASEKPEYEAARDEYYNGNFGQAIKKLDTFVQKYPNSVYAGNAIYWKGESYYAQAQFTNALREFNNVHSQYPKSWKIADAQLKIGMCHMNMGDHQTAKNELNKLKKDFPNYSRMDIVEKLLNQMQ